MLELFTVSVRFHSQEDEPSLFASSNAGRHNDEGVEKLVGRDVRKPGQSDGSSS